jgi:hypothetical protein
MLTFFISLILCVIHNDGIFKENEFIKYCLIFPQLISVPLSTMFAYIFMTIMSSLFFPWTCIDASDCSPRDFTMYYDKYGKNYISGSRIAVKNEFMIEVSCMLCCIFIFAICFISSNVIISNYYGA